MGTVFFFIVRGREDGKKAAKPDETVQPTINVASVYRGDIRQYVEALGTVTPIATVNVYTQLTGSVIGVHYAEGQMVRRGDPPIDIHPKPYQAQLLEAERSIMIAASWPKTGLTSRATRMPPRTTLTTARRLNKSPQVSC